MPCVNAVYRYCAIARVCVCVCVCTRRQRSSGVRGERQRDGEDFGDRESAPAARDISTPIGSFQEFQDLIAAAVGLCRDSCAVVDSSEILPGGASAPSRADADLHICSISSDVVNTAAIGAIATLDSIYNTSNTDIGLSLRSITLDSGTMMLQYSGRQQQCIDRSSVVLDMYGNEEQLIQDEILNVVQLQRLIALEETTSW